MMQNKSAQKPFTGRHMAAVLIGGFGIVVAVNLTMASYATSGFQGLVVENSYIASQHFNTWLEKAKEARALGWDARLERDRDGYVVVEAENVPEGAIVTAKLRRPIGEHEFATLDFEAAGEGIYRSTKPVSDGRWTARLFIEADGHQWAEESELR